MDDNKIVPFPTKEQPASATSAPQDAKQPVPLRPLKLTVSYTPESNGVGLQAEMPPQMAIFVLESAKHILMHSLKMVPMDPADLPPAPEATAPSA